MRPSLAALTLLGLSPAALRAETFSADVRADNWFEMRIDGVQVAEDSVPITTERSSDAESFAFSGTGPITPAGATDMRPTPGEETRSGHSGANRIGAPTVGPCSKDRTAHHIRGKRAADRDPTGGAHRFHPQPSFDDDASPDGGSAKGTQTCVVFDGRAARDRAMAEWEAPTHRDGRAASDGRPAGPAEETRASRRMSTRALPA